MKSTYNDGILKIIFPERIDSNNANDFESELFNLEKLDYSKKILLDFENLNYISSMGLRVILKLLKKYKGVQIISVNVSSEVYNILSTTGFTELLEVHKKLRKINTEQMKLLGTGMYGSVFRINEEQILKVFHGINSEDDIQPVIKTIQTAFVHGIPTLMPFEIVLTENGIGMILELLNSDTMSTLMQEKPKKFDEYIDDMIELAKTLAATNFEENSLRKRNEMLISKLENAAEFLLPEEISVIKNYINAIPNRNTAVHGDFHAKNIMIMDDKPMLIDMDEFSCGHPIWDIANANCIYQTMPHSDPEIFSDLFDIKGKMSYEDFYFRIIGCTFAEADHIWDRFFNGYFAGYSTEDKNSILKLVEFYANFKYITFLVDICNKLKNNPEKLAEKISHLRRILSELKTKNFNELIKYLDLWR